MFRIYFLVNETLKKYLLIIGISFSSMVLFTCSSITDIIDEIGDQFEDDINSLAAISGVVVDGYIGDAIVFLDCNKNFVRDVGENPVFTSGEGRYEFKDATEEEKQCPIVVDATDVARVYDKDDIKNGVKVSLKEAGREGFKISAPAGKYEVISPLTHIANTVKLTDKDVISKILTHMGLKPDELKAAGISLEDILYQDFIALSESGDGNSDFWKKLAKKARVMTRMLEAQQNKDGYSCIGKGCVENMKTVLGQFTNVYGSMINEDGSIAEEDFTTEKIKEMMADNQHEADFLLEEYEDISPTNLLKSSMQKQTTGNPCISENEANPDFRFFFTIFSPVVDEMGKKIGDSILLPMSLPQKCTMMLINGMLEQKEKLLKNVEIFLTARRSIGTMLL